MENAKYQIIIPQVVKSDLDEIISFYYVDRKDYAERIFNNFIKRINSLESMPEKGRIVPELEKQNIIEFREIIESYWRIIYRIEDKKVILLTIIDGRRNVDDILIKRLKKNKT